MDRSSGAGQEVAEVESSNTVKEEPKKGGFGKKISEVVQIEPLKLGRVQVTIVGDTSLIMHKFSEKGGLEAMRTKQWQTGDITKGKKRSGMSPG